MVDFGGMLKKGKDFANTQKKNFETKTASKDSTAPATTTTTTKEVSTSATTTEASAPATATEGTAPSTTESTATETTEVTAVSEGEGAEAGAAKSKFDINGLIKKGKEMDKKQLKNNAKDGLSVYKSFKYGGSFTNNATKAYKEVSYNRKKTAEEDKKLAEEAAAAEAKAAADAKAAAA
ncbi:hypothetical protein CLIB1423_08S01464 [[Candida] railenensis]|uniref:Uncharacterized protein n=1 Tax=[Candida] railenensis TaxID=45579 RepID=A0A9P0QP35_9ASCO|nr:hypothetical protein CLIB1423_08S01464 [[Candida] railenensis]